MATLLSNAQVARAARLAGPLQIGLAKYPVTQKYLLMGMESEKRGEWRQAEQHYRKAYVYDESRDAAMSNWQSYYDLGRVLARQGKLEEAVACWQQFYWFSNEAVAPEDPGPAPPQAVRDAIMDDARGVVPLIRVGQRQLAERVPGTKAGHVLWTAKADLDGDGTEESLAVVSPDSPKAFVDSDKYLVVEEVNASQPVPSRPTLVQPLTRPFRNDQCDDPKCEYCRSSRLRVEKTGSGQQEISVIFSTHSSEYDAYMYRDGALVLTYGGV